MNHCEAKERTWTAALGWILGGGSDRRVSQAATVPIGWDGFRFG
jgi:hypothetical protein